MDYYEIGQRIRKIRKAHKLSQEALAEKVGISVTHMSHIETGNTKLSLPVLVDLSAVLGVRTDELLFGADGEGEAAVRSAAAEAILSLLDSCTTPQLRGIEDTVKAVKASLEQHF